MSRLTLLTQSSLGTLQSCEEKFRLRYIEGLVPMQERPYFAIGSAVHRGVELRDPEAGVALLLEKRGQPWSDLERDELEVDSGIVRAMVSGALARWSEWPATVEHPFQLPIVNPVTGGRSTVHQLAGVQDGLWTERDKILELKTTSRLDRDYIARLDIDFQVTTYLAAASTLLGRPILEVVYRIIKKPGIRPHKGESDLEYRERCAARAPLAPLKQKATESDLEYQERSRLREEAREPLKRKIPETPEEYGARVLADYQQRPDFYFAQVRVTRTPADLERWRWEVWTLHERVLALERGDFPVRNTKACLDFGRCTYFDICTGAVGPDAFRVQEDANPELPKAIQPKQLTLGEN